MSEAVCSNYGEPLDEEPQDCLNCKYSIVPHTKEPCCNCENYEYWEVSKIVVTT